jgi:class 3 adenylate cyclase/tetratricopeptide (TPR) repeat protein
MSDIGEWLDDIGLSEYTELLRAHDIGVDVIGDLTTDELRALGISLGNAKRIQRAAQGDAAGATSQSAERLQITVLFCDMVDSATISERLDPEDLRTILDEYYRRCERVADEHGGTVGKVAGDGVNIYFGYPKAIEHSATAAVMASLDIIDQIEQMNSARPHGTPAVEVRISVHTGVAVVGQVGGSAAEVVGDVPVVAARIQSLAAPGTVVVTDATARLVGADVDLVDIGAHSLKGLSAPLTVYRVQRHAAVYRAHARPSTDLFEGRDDEVAVLRAQWSATLDGNGGAVHIAGDAGIGKSRLAGVLDADLDGQQTVEYRCSPHRSGTPLWPIVERLRRSSGVGAVESEVTKIANLRAYLERSARHHADDDTELFAALLGISSPGADLSQLGAADELRDRTLRAIVDRLRARSLQQPLLVRFEDIHWADPTTLRLLTLLVEATQSSPLMVVLTSRPEMAPNWPPSARVVTINLSRIDDRSARAIIARLPGGSELPEHVVGRILELTDGVPLFVEELTRTVVETRAAAVDAGVTGGDPGFELTIPSTLRDSLWARLERLGPVRDVAQVASVIGREFSVTMLTEVLGADVATVRRAVATLDSVKLIEQRDPASPEWYVFRHALVQGAAYDSMLRVRRRELHGRVADVLGSRPRADLENAEPLAQHLDLAGRVDDAIEAYMRLGDRVAAGSNHEEALAHYRRALELAESQPRTRAGLIRQLDVHGAIRNALVVLRGYSSDEVAEACEVARSICEEIGDSEQLFPVLWNLAGFHMVRGEHQASADINDVLLDIATRTDDESLALLAHSTIGQTKHYQGQLTESVAHLGVVAQRYDIDRHGDLAVRYAEEDPGSASLAYGATTLWLLGERTTALEWMNRALALSEALPYQATKSLVIATYVQLAYLRRTPALLERVTPRLEELFVQRGFGFANPTARCNLGWIRVVDGRGDEGLAMMRAGTAELAAIGAVATGSFSELLLADGLLRLERPSDALEVLQHTLAAVRSRGERTSEPELLRVTAEARLRDGAPLDEVAGLLAEARTAARTIGARTIELHVAISRARIGAGDPLETRAQLAGAIAAIDQETDEADMHEARALLDSAGGSGGSGRSGMVTR